MKLLGKRREGRSSRRSARSRSRGWRGGATHLLHLCSSRTHLPHLCWREGHTYRICVGSTTHLVHLCASRTHLQLPCRREEHTCSICVLFRHTCRFCVGEKDTHAASVSSWHTVGPSVSPQAHALAASESRKSSPRTPGRPLPAFCASLACTRGPFFPSSSGHLPPQAPREGAVASP